MSQPDLGPNMSRQSLADRRGSLPAGDRHDAAADAAAAVVSGPLSKGGPSLAVLSHLTGALDVAAIWIAAWVAVEIAIYMGGPGTAPQTAVFAIAPMTSVLAVFGFATAGLYSAAQMVRVARQSVRLLVIWAVIAALGALASAPFFSGRYEILFAWMCTAPAFILAFRSTVALGLREGLKHRLIGERIALIGSQDHIDIARHFMALDRLVHLDLTVSVPQGDDGPLDDKTLDRLYQPIAEAVRSGHLDTAVLLVPAQTVAPLAPLIDRLGTQAIRVALLPMPVLQVWNGLVDFEMDRAVVTITERPIRGWGLLLKAAMDFVGAGFGLALFGLPMLVIAALIKLDSPGPVFFRQRRHGQNGEVFRIWKFRSMTVCEDGSYIKQAEQNDARVTRIGKFIRSTSLDELPQFFNVLTGEMSIIGPRPHALAHDELYAPLIPAYTQRFRVKPGITGWAQVNGLRGETKSLQDMADRIEYDVDYTRRWWIGLDIFILLKTPFVGFMNRRAY